jgi:hypothetical protein
MEKTFLTYKHKAFNDAVKEFDTEIILIGDYDYKVDGKLITHLAINEDNEMCAVAGVEDDALFWEHDYEQMSLTKSQWKDIVNIVEDLLQ